MKTVPTSESDAGALGEAPAGTFLERMLSGVGHAPQLPPAGVRKRTEGPYRALRQSKASRGAAYRLQTSAASLPVGGDSPATEVMTDLSRIAAVTTSAGATIRAARESMIAHGVRALFVVDETRAVLGLVTSTDIAGEKPIQIAQQQHEPYDAVLVREVMTPAELVEAMDFEDVLYARVGDIIQTLRSCGRQHALVIESVQAGESPPTHIVRGIFSLTQIARQLGLSPQPSHDVARTFAEIEAAIGP